ncbi:MAG: hypothetical protein RLZZ299_1910 [Pseudomonadota bacterium]
MPSMLAFVLLACATTVETFPEDYAEALCARTEECDRGAFEREYATGMDACVADRTEAIAEVAANCDWVELKAKACLEELHNETCGELDDGASSCADAYSCDAGDIIDILLR